MEARAPETIEALPSVLRRHAESMPDERAYTFLGDGEEISETITYEQLDRRAQALAGALQERELARKRALLAHPSGIDFIVALFACQYAGVVAVPANLAGAGQIRSIVPRLEAIAEDAELSIVLAPKPVVDAREALVPDGSPLRALEWLETDPGEDAEPAAAPERIAAHELALIQYTSGSTGTPRGVMLSHSNLYRQAEIINEVFGGAPGDAVVSWLPLFHDMGLVSSVLCPLYGGYHSAFMPPVAFLQRPLRWLEAVDRFEAKIAGGPNFAYDLCIRKTTEAERAALDLSSWRVAFNGAEPVYADTLERFEDAFRVAGFQWSSFAPCYGLAEATCGVACARERVPPEIVTVDAAKHARGTVVAVGDGVEAGRRLVGAGPVVRDHEVRIVDPDTLEPAAPGRVGELWVRGPCVGMGYWEAPEVSDEVFGGHLAGGEGPFLRTGDLGFLVDGELFIGGRLKDIVIVHGLNYYPQDIERSAQRAHPGLRPGCGAAFALAGPDGERVVVVQEVADAGAAGDELSGVASTIRAAIVRDLGIPVDRVVLIGPRTIPKTSSGKVQRRRCREAFERGELAVVGETG